MSDQGSPRSVSSDLSDSPPALDLTTLALLDSHFAARAEEEELFSQLVADRVTNYVAGSGLDVERAESDYASERLPLSVVDFQKAFGEDWQLSQFWLGDLYASNLPL